MSTKGSKKRILVVLDNEFDADARVKREVNLLVSRGYQVTVLCYDYGQSVKPRYEQFAVDRIRISRSWINKIFPLYHILPLFSWFWTRQIYRRIISFQPDIVLAHDLYMSLPARKAIDKSGLHIKLFLDLHENYPAAILSYNWATRGLRKYLVRPSRWALKEQEYLGFADRIVVLSQSFADLLSKRYPDLGKDRFVVFPNVPDTSLMDESPINKEVFKSSLNGPIMFYFGVVGERRGIFESLEAFKSVVAHGVNIHFLIVGPCDRADKARFVTYVQDEALKGKLEYIPWISVDDLPTYLASVDFCIAPFEVNPQHESGIANKLFQYMYGRKAIIASNCKPQADLIKGADCGIIYRNMEELEEAISFLADHPERRIRMGENGYGTLKEKYNLETVSQEFIKSF